jgi:hypothetical protein
MSHSVYLGVCQMATKWRTLKKIVKILNNIPGSEASRQVANLTERKNPPTHVYFI